MTAQNPPGVAPGQAVDRRSRALRIGDPLPTTVDACDAELVVLDRNLVEIQRQLSPDVAPRIEAAQPGWRGRVTAAAASIAARRQLVVDRRALLERQAARADQAAREAAAAERRAERAAAAAAERASFQAAFMHHSRSVLPSRQFAAVLAAVDRVAPNTLPKWAAKLLARARAAGDVGTDVADGADGRPAPE